MCLAQGPQRSDAGEAQTRSPSVSRVKHSTTEPLRSPCLSVIFELLPGLIPFASSWHAGSILSACSGL